MATTSWRPSLKSCDQARRIGEESDDLFGKLPEEILMSIMSYFTVKEAARFSLVSRQCEVIWRYFPVLIFEDYKAMETIWDSWDAIFEDRACFVRKVDRVLEKHLGTTIDESCCLTSLCLRDVNVSDEFFDYLPHSCPLLETLCIENSRCLTRVTGSLQVKRLEVTRCHNLEKIEVSARKIDLARPLLGKLMNDVAMPKLEHLEFQVSNAMVHSSLYRCIIVLASSPNLQKLTLKLENFGTKERNREVRRCVSYGSPLTCLKTLELVGYRGKPVDLELAFFVLENASMLEEIIVDFIIPLNDNVKRERLEMLQMKIPQGVKLTVK
ncbi:uncharacterized protein LOC141641952 [Silene latifolia]|uniref:uncharacterized protein LOC141641952 n=1 Tax=Silene latifolia TaxID=37657 RepID=UPI003D774491